MSTLLLYDVIVDINWFRHEGTSPANRPATRRYMDVNMTGTDPGKVKDVINAHITTTLFDTHPELKGKWMIDGMELVSAEIVYFDAAGKRLPVIRPVPGFSHADMADGTIHVDPDIPPDDDLADGEMDLDHYYMGL